MSFIKQFTQKKIRFQCAFSLKLKEEIQTGTLINIFYFLLSFFLKKKDKMNKNIVIIFSKYIEEVVRAAP